ncbi:Retrovirus-related Pol polyprotein from transposon 17.6, partial [Mucuna pruriens]
MRTNFRPINNIIVRYRNPIPCLDYLLGELHRSQMFSKIDLKSGYHQVRLNEGDEWKTTFKEKLRLYEWLFMPFGLTNAPSKFMRLINQVLRSLISKCVVVYFDDILNYSTCLNDHLLHARSVLENFRKEILFSNLEKCIFCTGLASFYKRFVHDFSSLATSLNDVVRNVGFKWEETQERAFQGLKERLILALPNFSKFFELECYAYGVGIRVILLQERHQIAYFNQYIIRIVGSIFNKRGKEARIGTIDLSPSRESHPRLFWSHVYYVPTGINPHSAKGLTKNP